MIPPKDVREVLQRYNHAKQVYALRDQLVTLCREVYEMTKTRKSSYLGQGANNWRSKVPTEYWQADNRPHNVIDLITSVLSGHPPYYQCTVPGSVDDTVASRAEKFIGGVWRINSRRQQTDLVRDLVFRVSLDGAAVIRQYWDGQNPQPASREMVPGPGGEPWVQTTYEDRDFPLCVEVLKVDKVYPLGRGRMGRPFDELIHCEGRTPNEVIYEWEGVEGADVSALAALPVEERMNSSFEYLEWWGDHRGQIFHAIVYKDKWVVQPREINYPSIPYVIVSFKKYDRDKPSLENIPFLYPMLHASNKWEYLNSRIMRLTDMYANLPPVYEGDAPMNIGGTWGKVHKVGRGEKITFPQWPGHPPDVYHLVEDIRQQQSEASFSSTMFGQLSPKAASGYALGQVIGADTIRTDTPRSNIELGLAASADMTFGFLRRFAAEEHLAVVAQVKNQRMSAVLAGKETLAIVTECSVKPKATQDEIRRATIGAQLASIPNSPISLYRILQDYFDIPQPEEEMERKRLEEAERDPLMKLMALSKTLHDAGPEYAQQAAIVDQQLQQAVGQQLQPGGAPPGMPPQQGMPQDMGQLGTGQPDAMGGGDMAQMGMGLPQSVFGNAPNVPPSGNVVEENPTNESALYGGPVTGQ